MNEKEWEVADPKRSKALQIHNTFIHVLTNNNLTREEKIGKRCWISMKKIGWIGIKSGEKGAGYRSSQCARERERFALKRKTTFQAKRSKRSGTNAPYYNKYYMNNLPYLFSSCCRNRETFDSSSVRHTHTPATRTVAFGVENILFCLKSTEMESFSSETESKRSARARRKRPESEKSKGKLWIKMRKARWESNEYVAHLWLYNAI